MTIETEDGTKSTFDGKAGEMRAGGLEGVTEWKSLMHQEQGTKVNGMVHGKTTHKAEDVLRRSRRT